MISDTVKPDTGIAIGIVTPNTVTFSSSSSLLSSSPVGSSSSSLVAFGLKGRRPRKLIVDAAAFDAVTGSTRPVCPPFLRPRAGSVVLWPGLHPSIARRVARLVRLV